MASVIVKLKIMPTGTDVSLDKLHMECEAKIKAFGAKLIHSVNQEPVAFGLKALVIVFLVDEQNSNMEALEAEIKKVKGVNSAEVIDVRRALG
ncbi:MAG TPA: elongation factor 1-beta [Candidatus Nanoarchaeia archaeon]|nr:elongation factor 1-beta [Candidatus Nanoarchaeia archaeon]